MFASQAIAADAALSVFSHDAQHDRLMRLGFPRGDGPDAILLPNRLRAHEEVSRCFRFDVELLSDDARIPLKAMMARMVTISLVREDGSLRHFNGYVTEFRFLRTDGGFAFYHMVLAPWLAFARLRKDNVSFHGKSVIELTELTFARYRQADWHAAIVGEYPRMTCANQYDETDYNHLHRRWEDLGLHYWYEHRADGRTLWLSDRSTLAQPIDPTGIDDAGIIPFRDQAGSLEEDGIRAWSAVRRIGSGRTTLASFDYKNPVAQRSTAESLNRQGDVFAYEIYENTGSYGFHTHGVAKTVSQTPEKMPPLMLSRNHLKAADFTLRDGQHSAQLMRTYPAYMEKSIKECYANLTRLAQHYIFIQNQYIQYEDWATYLTTCAETLRNAGYTKPIYVFVLTSTPESDGMDLATYDVALQLAHSDAMVTEHAETVERAKQGKAKMPITAEELEKRGIKALMGSMWTCAPTPRSADDYEETYIHAKVAIVDDAAFTLGSANLNVRSMALDSELNLLSQARDVAFELRKKLFKQCTDKEGPAQFANMKDTFKKWQTLLGKNTKAMANGQPLAGQIATFHVDRQPGSPVI